MFDNRTQRSVERRSKTGYLVQFLAEQRVSLNAPPPGTSLPRTQIIIS